MNKELPDACSFQGFANVKVKKTPLIDEWQGSRRKQFFFSTKMLYLAYTFMTKSITSYYYSVQFKFRGYN